MEKIVSPRPTQKQIAEKLGLSAATVSLALRDNPVVAKATRDLVQQAMRDVGYVRNLAAASLRTGRSNIVGVSIHNIAHSYFGEMLIAIERAFAASGTVILINNHDEDVGKLERFIGTLATYGADALLVAPPPETPVSLMDTVRKHGMHPMYFRRYLEDDDTSDYVGIDNEKAVTLAVQHLVRNGYNHIHLVGGEPGTSVARERVDGFRTALKGAGIEWNDELWHDSPANGEGGRAAMEKLFKRNKKPFGVICYNDLVGAGAISAAHAAGRAIGRDVGIISIGGTGATRMTSPPLTTVDVDTMEVGKLAAETLLQRLSDPESAPKRIALEPRLLLGESCGSLQEA